MKSPYIKWLQFAIDRWIYCLVLAMLPLILRCSIPNPASTTFIELILLAIQLYWPRYLALTVVWLLPYLVAISLRTDNCSQLIKGEGGTQIIVVYFVHFLRMRHKIIYLISFNSYTNLHTKW